MRRVILFLFILMLAVPSFGQAPVRGDWVACPTILEAAGVCVNGEAIFFIIAPVATSVKARDASCWQGGYQAEVDDGNGNMIPNPMPCKKFAVSRVYHIWKEWYAAQTARDAANAAAQQALADARAELGDVVPED